MAISLETLQKVRADQAPRILIYGPEKIGKTSLAAEFPTPVFLQAEKGTPGGVELMAWDIATFEQMMEALGVLYNDDHSFKTVVADSATAFQAMVYAETGARGDDKGNRKARIEDFGYGKGYVYALAVWQEFLDGLNALRRDRGMNVILLAHSKAERFDDPDTVSYSRYVIDLHEKAAALLKREMDLIALVKQDVTIKEEDEGFNRKRAIGAGGASRWIYTAGRPAFEAGTRYDMPEKLLYAKGRGYAALAPYLPAQPQTDTKPTATKTAAKSRVEAVA